MANDITKNNTPVDQLAPHIDQMNEIFNELLDVMAAQIDAVVASDIEQVEKLTDQHSVISSRLKKKERVFISEIENLMKDGQEQSIRLSGLKKRFPEASAKIDTWRQHLLEKTRQLQQKHDQVVQLLEFAMVKNANLMRTIYSVHNDKTRIYNPSGNNEKITSGVALNQKA